MMRYPKKLVDAVKRGAVLMDAISPDWAQKLVEKNGALDMDDADHCVLGTTMKSYWTARDVIFAQFSKEPLPTRDGWSLRDLQAEKYGFLPMGENWKDTSNQLAGLWTAAATDRVTGRYRPR
jgi:hypothetical protein